MYWLLAFATRFCLRHCVFLCKGTKLQKAALFAIVCRFFCGTELRFGTEISCFSAGVLSQNSGIRLVLNPGAGCRFYAQSFVYTQSFPYWHRNSRICNLDGTIPCAKTADSGLYRILAQAAVFMHRALFIHRALLLPSLQL